MTKPGIDRPPRNTLSRRRALELASGATAFTFWQRKPHGLPATEYFIDRVAVKRIADRDLPRPPILIDAQTHGWWRAGGIRQTSECGEHFLKLLAGSRASVVGIQCRSRIWGESRLLLHEAGFVMPSFGHRVVIEWSCTGAASGNICAKPRNFIPRMQGLDGGYCLPT
jgi:hypothetical protein